MKKFVIDHRPTIWKKERKKKSHLGVQENGSNKCHDMEKSKKGLVILDALTFPCNVYDDTLKESLAFVVSA